MFYQTFTASCANPALIRFCALLDALHNAVMHIDVVVKIIPLSSIGSQRWAHAGLAMHAAATCAQAAGCANGVSGYSAASKYMRCVVMQDVLLPAGVFIHNLFRANSISAKLGQARRKIIIIIA